MSERREPGIPANSERGPSGPAPKAPRAGGGADRAPLRIVSPDASPEEVAAIAAAISAVMAEREAAARTAAAVSSPNDVEALDAWVRATRLSARRSGLDRGPWRLSGRIGRRARA